MKFVSIRLTTLLCIPISLSAQASKWCSYQLRTPDSIIAWHTESEDVRGSDFIATADPFPSRGFYYFTGGVRPIADQRRDFLQKYFVFRKLKGSDSLFQREVEMKGRDGGSLWFPIQETMFEDFKSEVSPGDSTTLFLLWAGGVGPKDHAKDWIFLINEFTSARSRKFWADELASCLR